MSDHFPYSFGKYQIESEIGRGGFGTVFRAVDEDLERPVAIKVLDPLYMRDQRWVARFRREARVMAKLDHRHIVPIYEIGEADGRLYLTMKFIDGPDLTNHLNKKGALSWDVTVDLVAQMASALDYAHQQGIIHRDLKPANILISNGQALLTDFGLAQMLDDNSQSVSISGGIVGTYNYMAPEVFNNLAITAASDVYALGCVIYEMLDGQMLFDGQSTAAIIGAHLKGITFDKPLPAGTPPGVIEILQIALAKDPLDRFASASELAQELERVAQDRIAGPYLQLENALAARNWPEALTLAEQVRRYNPNYRDVAALEEQAKRGQWSDHWLNQADIALANDDFDALQIIFTQWRKVDPNDPRIKQKEDELALAKQNKEEIPIAPTIDELKTTENDPQMESSHANILNPVLITTLLWLGLAIPGIVLPNYYFPYGLFLAGFVIGSGTGYVLKRHKESLAWWHVLSIGLVFGLTFHFYQIDYWGIITFEMLINTGLGALMGLGIGLILRQAGVIQNSKQLLIIMLGWAFAFLLENFFEQYGNLQFYDQRVIFIILGPAVAGAVGSYVMYQQIENSS